MSMYYLQLDGFAGRSTHPKYRGWIELQWLTFLYGDSVTPRYPSSYTSLGGVSAQSNLTGLSTSVIMDQTASALFGATARGMLFSRGALALVTTRANNTEFEYARWLLTNIRFANFRTDGSTIPPQAFLTLAFEKSV